MNREYNPDVLNCIANLSNDEVFTPPQLANQVLDMLPQELFRSPDTTFLDPFCKSGVFLREIVKRLDRGLANAIPNRQKRIDHILHKQVFGIALTELTSLLSRRTLYCSKSANSEHSVSYFDSPQGHILYTPLHHTWQNGKCKYCGASREVYDRGTDAEQYAYQFIHTDNPSKIFNMTFDVIIGNPPYQLSDGGGTGSSAMPLYHKFVEQAMKLQPRYLSMIIPARWMTGGKGLDAFRSQMIADRHIRILHDYMDASMCFVGVNIEGGVCYFLWSKNEEGLCHYILHQANGEEIQTDKYLDENGTSDIVIRDPNIISILDKVRLWAEPSFEKLVSTRNPFKIQNDMIDSVTSPIPSQYSLFCLQNRTRTTLFLKKRFNVNCSIPLLQGYKLFISKADGAAGQIGNPIPARIIGKAVIAEPYMLCTETFLAVGPFKSKDECVNVQTYMETKFFRFLVGIRKNKNMTHDTYLYAPQQDFSHPWTDEMLYSKYRLSSQEIAFIESMIRPMD